MMAAAHKPLFVPEAGRTRWAYSNTNYLLAGMIARRRAAPAAGSWSSTASSPDWACDGGARWSILSAHALRDTYPTGTDGTRLHVTRNSATLHTADSGVVSTTADLNTFFAR